MKELHSQKTGFVYVCKRRHNLKLNGKKEAFFNLQAYFFEGFVVSIFYRIRTLQQTFWYLICNSASLLGWDIKIFVIQIERNCHHRVISAPRPGASDLTRKLLITYKGYISTIFWYIFSCNSKSINDRPINFICFLNGFSCWIQWAYF